VLEKSGKVIAATFAAAVMVGAAGCHSSSSPRSAGVTGTNDATASNAPATSASTPASGARSTAPASTTPAATATASTGTKTGGGSTSTQKPPGKPTGFTRPGSYTYDVSGTATQPFGGSQNVSGTSTQAVDPPQGSNQHSKTDGQNGSQETTIDVRQDGLHVLDIAIASQGFNEDFKPVGDALYFSSDYRVGRKWSWQAKSTDGKYTLDVTTKISGNGTVPVGGKSLNALIADSTLHITGTAFDLTVQQRDWVSTTYALVLKEHSVSHGTAYGANISSDITRKLRSTTPS
jgi:hypothetical protein